MKLSTAIKNDEVKISKVVNTATPVSSTEKELVEIKKLLRQILNVLKKT
tara:strand:+ start:751 stop:897 length:147 start_codon:yes stop_codon:yes gene_type:complete